MITTGEFLEMLAGDYSWITGEDFGDPDDILLRKNCARILHRYLQKVMHEPDETECLPVRSDIPDLFDCRICAPHIVQVIAKGIMEPFDEGGIKLFKGDTEVTEKEAETFVSKISA